MNRRVATTFVIALFLLTFEPTTAFAQHPVRGIQLPDLPTWTVLLRNALATAASHYDAALPSMPLEAWIEATLAPVVAVPFRQLVDWRMLPCSEPRSDIRPALMQLCADGIVHLSVDRDAHILIRVATADPTVVAEWVPVRPVPPSLRDVYIERINAGPKDSLDVPTLHELPRRLTTPFEQWPELDLATTTTWTPLMPAPGDTVHFSIAVRNASARAADPAAITILISPCCAQAQSIRHETLQYLAPGEAMRFETEVFLPEGRAMVAVSVRPGPSHKVMRQAARSIPLAETPVGVPAYLMPGPAPVVTVTCAGQARSTACLVSATLNDVPVPVGNITITSWDWGDGTMGATGTGSEFVSQSRTYAATKRADGYRITVAATVAGSGRPATGSTTVGKQ